ncbi:MAG: UDP-3-O-acyl-N-acetylglucosamine deacetylase, partial [Candidatus Thiodiazotropha taylori]
LDAIGDLYLLGHSLVGAFNGHKSGHALNNRLLLELISQEDAWEEITFDEPEDAPISYMQPAHLTVS